MIRIEENSSGFQIFFKDKPLLFHSPGCPAAGAGRGAGRYKFHYGLFKIRDSRRELRFPADYSITGKDPESFSVLFGGDIRLSGRVEEGRLVLDMASAREGDNRLVLHLTGDGKDSIYGCGQQYSYLEMKGRKVPIWVMEPGLGRGKDLISLDAEIRKGYGGRWYSSYVSQPTYITTGGRFVHSEATAYTELDFRKKEAEKLEIWQNTAVIHIGHEPTPPALLKGLTGLLGRQPPLPPWVWDGMILGIQGGREETRKKLQDALDKDVKVAALWCQDWEGIRITSFGKQLFWDWKASEELYPDLSGYIKELQERGISFLGYINQFLALEGALYKEASAKGYCIKDKTGKDYYVTITTFPAAMVDLSNPKAVLWLKKVIRKNMIDTGLRGWMADFGEYIPADAVVHSGEDAETYHNRYTVEWARINREVCQESGREDIFFFMRSAYSGSSRFAVSLWNGDQLVNWSRHQGFPTIIPGSLSLGYSGYGNVHSDLGGYTTVAYLKRSKELFMRWAEASAFSPTMRTHEGNRPQAGWLFNSDGVSLEHLARFSRIFSHMAPYHKALAREYQEAGLPPMRHGWIHYPRDREFRKIRYQYMYGPDLIVAPVIRRRKKRWKVYIPEGGWKSLWNDRSIPKGWSTVEAPLGKPPVFYRAKSEFASLFKEMKTL